MAETEVRKEAVRALSRFKGQPLAGQMLRDYFDGKAELRGRSKNRDGNVFYALSALGFPEHREFVEYHASHGDGAAKTALDLWGKATFEEILATVLPPKTENSSPCYVATACYGSSDAPEVVFLRQFRDTNLAQRGWGKLLIHLYYLTSPRLAGFLADAPHLNRFVRKTVLDQLVRMIGQRNRS